MFEVCAFPGRRAALGANRKDAEERLQKLLETEMGDNPSAWWTREFDKLSHDDRDSLNDACRKVVMHLAEKTNFRLGSRECVAVQDDKLCAAGAGDQ